MYGEEDLDIYYFDKIFTAFMHDNCDDTYKDNPWLYEIDALEDFKEVVLTFAEQNCIAPHIKENIYKILVDGREIKDENYEKRVEIINSIICELNKQTGDLSNAFYYSQLKIRRNEDKVLEKYTLQHLRYEIPRIDDSIYNDFTVLYSHSEKVDDEEFLTTYLPVFSKSNYYYESLNMILKECPCLFKDELFASRVNLVLRNVRKVDRVFNGTHKKIKKQVKKYK